MEDLLLEQNRQAKIAWLARYTSNAREIERLWAELAEWRALAARTTMRLGGELGPGALSPFEDKVQRAVDELAEVESELLAELRRRTGLRRDIGAAINGVKEERLATLLRLRYIDGMTWERVADRMHYSVMQTQRLHKVALGIIDISGDKRAAGRTAAAM